jgi:RNA polymerase sigma-70 factor (ECF subfamily)
MSITRADPSLTHQLVARCASGETEAWRDLHRKYYGVAASFLRRLGVPADALEDACQEVFLGVFRYLPGFRGEADFRTWLYRICISQASRVRRRAKTGRLLRQFLSWHAEGAAMLPDTDVMEHRVEKAFSQLSERERVVFIMYELQGVPGKEIAQILGCPESTVWRRLHYARQRFRASLGIGGGNG